MHTHVCAPATHVSVQMLISISIYCPSLQPYLFPCVQAGVWIDVCTHVYACVSTYEDICFQHAGPLTSKAGSTSLSGPSTSACVVHAPVRACVHACVLVCVCVCMRLYVLLCVRACACVRVRACVRACVRASVRASMRPCVEPSSSFNYDEQHWSSWAIILKRNSLLSMYCVHPCVDVFCITEFVRSSACRLEICTTAFVQIQYG